MNAGMNQQTFELRLTNGIFSCLKLTEHYYPSCVSTEYAFPKAVFELSYAHRNFTGKYLLKAQHNSPDNNYIKITDSHYIRF